jgi:outer membrane murein-binding lipoprotein Lpp
MNLKPALLAVMAELGVTGTELETLRARLMFSVTSLQAQVNALDAQIATLTAQRDAARQELEAALVTASKLVDPAAPETEADGPDPVAGA